MEHITSIGILNVITNTIPGLEEQSMKQLQFPPIDHLISYPIFMESHSPYASNTTDDLYYECSDINVKTVSLILTSTSSNETFDQFRLVSC